MEQTQKPSRRLLLVGLAAAVGLILVIGILAFVLFGSTKREANTEAANSTADTKQVATKEEVKQNLDDLNTTIKQANTDQAAAKAALKDGSNPVKVGS